MRKPTTPPAVQPSNTPAKPSALPTGNTANGAVASASPAQVATAKALASATTAALAVANLPTPGPQPKAPGLRTVPANVLAALVAKGATLAHVQACPKRPGTAAATAWATLAKQPTVAAALANVPAGALHVAYGLAHGQCVATLPGGVQVGNTSGQPMGLAQLAAVRQALGLAS